MAGEEHDVVVIGAGLAGLTAARILHRFSYDVVLLESSADVGGRVRTDVLDGFRLDHGFQLFNPAYPAGARTFDYRRLALRPFIPGVEVRHNGRWSLLTDPLRERSALRRTAATTLRGSVAPPWHLAAFAAYCAACAAEPPARLRLRPDATIASALGQWGVGHQAIQRLVGPFLAGVFADLDLSTSRRYADLVLRSFVRGTPAVPAAGMQALPEQIAADLPADSLRLNTHVQCITGQTVSTSEGQLRGRVVLVATDAVAAGVLLPGLQVPAMASLSTWYFTTDRPPPHGQGVLLLGSPKLCNVAVLTSAAPTYSTSGASLVAATRVGHHPDHEAANWARTQTADLLGLPAAALTEVGRYPIRHALPVFGVGTPLQRRVDLGHGTLVIGDHRQTPSIQGALASGERGARAAVRLLGFRG